MGRDTWPFEGESMMVFVQTQMGDISNIQLPDDLTVAKWSSSLLALGKGMPSLLRSVKKSARGADVQRNLNNDATDKLTEWLLLLAATDCDVGLTSSASVDFTVCLSCFFQGYISMIFWGFNRDVNGIWMGW